MTHLPTKMRAKQASKEFSVGLSTIWLYAAEGKLHPIKVSPRVTVFDTAELLKVFGGVQ